MRAWFAVAVAVVILAGTIAADDAPRDATAREEGNDTETWTVSADTSALGAHSAGKASADLPTSYDADFDGDDLTSAAAGPAQGDEEGAAEPEEAEPTSTLLQLGTVVGWVVFMGSMWLGYLYMNQNNVLYHPEQPAGYRRPKDLPPMMRMGSPANREPPMPYTNLFVETPDKERIHVWLIHAQSEELRDKVPTIVFLHGNAGNMGLRLPNTEAIYAACRGTVNIAMVDYRGYGESSGKPDEEGLGRDIDAVLCHLRTSGDVDPENIYVFGRSLGGAVAVRGAVGSERGTVRGLVLENTFTCVADMVDRLMPSLRLVKGLVLRIYWPTEERLRTLGDVPTLFISGSKDALIPPAFMARNYKAHPGPETHKHFVRVVSGEHNDTWQRGGWRYYAEMFKFIRRTATPGAAEAMHVPTRQWWEGWGRRGDLVLWRRAREQRTPRAATSPAAEAKAPSAEALAAAAVAAARAATSLPRPPGTRAAAAGGVTVAGAAAGQVEDVD